MSQPVLPDADPNDPIGPDAARQAVLGAAVAAAGIGTFDLDLVTGTLDWDRQLLDMFGYAEADFDRSINSFDARVHPDDRERVHDAIAAASATCGELDVEYRVRRPDGSTLWVAGRGKVLCDADGTPRRLLGAAYDTTARRDADARVARVMDSMGTAFFSLDREWRFSYLNSQAERVLGRTGAELLGGNVWELFPAAVGSDFETHYREAVRSGETVAFDAWYPDPLNAWFEVRAWPNPDGLAVYFLDVTDRRRAQEEAQRSVTRASLLGRISEALSATLEPEEAVGRLAQLVVPVLADWATVTLIDDSRQSGTRRGLRTAGAWHADPARRDAALRYARARLDAMHDDSMVVRAIETATMQHIERDAKEAVLAMLSPGTAYDAMVELDPEAALVLPLTGSERPVGMLSLCNGPDRGSFTDDEVALAREVAARAGLVLDRARLYRQQREVAEGLQRSLLTEPPATDHLAIAVRYSPAAEATRVGGDWYDAFLQRDGTAVLVIGDVMGHDVSAAAAMGQVRTLVRGTAALSGGRPAAVLEQVDGVIDTLRLATTATAVVARLERDGPTTTFRWSNAGHPPPLRIGADGAVTVLDSRPDLLLGVVPDAARTEHVAALAGPATVLLYTDGLIERRNSSISEGIDRLVAVLADVGSLEVEALCDEVLARMLPDHPDDDIALVAVRVLP